MSGAVSATMLTIARSLARRAKYFVLLAVPGEVRWGQGGWWIGQGSTSSSSRPPAGASGML